MNHTPCQKQEFLDLWFSIVDNIYSVEEIQNILTAINNADKSKPELICQTAKTHFNQLLALIIFKRQRRRKVLPLSAILTHLKTNY
jgi:hypothetical protein